MSKIAKYNCSPNSLLRRTLSINCLSNTVSKSFKFICMRTICTAQGIWNPYRNYSLLMSISTTIEIITSKAMSIKSRLITCTRWRKSSSLCKRSINTKNLDLLSKTSVHNLKFKDRDIVKVKFRSFLHINPQVKDRTLKFNQIIKRRMLQNWAIKGNMWIQIKDNM